VSAWEFVIGGGLTCLHLAVLAWVCGGNEETMRPH
jgi:hypothetical protein